MKKILLPFFLLLSTSIFASQFSFYNNLGHTVIVRCNTTSGAVVINLPPGGPTNLSFDVNHPPCPLVGGNHSFFFEFIRDDGAFRGWIQYGMGGLGDPSCKGGDGTACFYQIYNSADHIAPYPGGYIPSSNPQITLNH